MNIYLLLAFICGFVMGVIILTLFGIMKTEKLNRDDRLERIYRSIENNDKVSLEELNNNLKTEILAASDLSINQKVKSYYFSVKRKLNKVKS